MKNIFQKVANAFNDITFTIPRLQLDSAQKDYLNKNGYKTTRCQMPVVMSPYSIATPMISYDHISKKDGTDLTSREYRELTKQLEAIGNSSQAPAHKL